jgi:hypothetical protein
MQHKLLTKIKSYESPPRPPSYYINKHLNFTKKLSEQSRPPHIDSFKQLKERVIEPLGLDPNKY